jgi:hypothetical protein
VSYAWQVDVRPTTTKLWAIGQTDPAFAGIGLNHSTQSVIVYRKGGTPSAAYTDAADPGVAIEFQAAMLSADEANKTMNAVVDAKATFAAIGSEVTGVHTNFFGPIVIGVTNVTPAAEGLARKFETYGRGTVVLRQEVGPTPAVGRNSSGADT